MEQQGAETGKGTKGSHEGAKWSPTGVKREPKGANGSQKGAEGSPQGAQSEPKGDQDAAQHRLRHQGRYWRGERSQKGGQREPKWMPKHEQNQ